MVMRILSERIAGQTSVLRSSGSPRHIDRDVLHASLVKAQLLVRFGVRLRDVIQLCILTYGADTS